MTATARNSAGVVVGKYAVPGARCGRAESYVTIDRVAGIAVRHPEHCGRFRLPDGDPLVTPITVVGIGLAVLLVVSAVRVAVSGTGDRRSTV
jgi:hypothetical protein